MNNINSIWENIIRHEGDVFYTVTGLEFTYEVIGNAIQIYRDEKHGQKTISKNNFEKALSYQQYDSKEFSNKIWGPSYVRGILEDYRIK